MVFIFLFSSLNLSDGLHGIGVYLVYTLLGATSILPLFILKKQIKIDIPTFILIYLFLLFSSISALLNSDVNLILGALMIFLLYIVSCIILPMLKIDLNKIVFGALLVSHIPITIIPLILGGSFSAPYKGIFYNTNSFGTVSATIFVVLLSNFLGKLEKVLGGTINKYQKIWMIGQGALLVFLLYLVVISSSRTSFLASIMCIAIGLFYIIVALIKRKRLIPLLNKGFIFLCIFSVVASLVLYFTKLDEAIENDIIYKFEYRASNETGILSERDQIWKHSIQESRLFGRGDAFFTDMGIGAHNTLVSILGRYGWLPLLTFLTLLTIILYVSIKYSYKGEDDHNRYLPLLIFVSFLVMSMGEDMTFKVSMVVMFFSFGGMLSKKVINLPSR